ncbi:chemotaxis protein [Burkholderia sp. Ax-1719]|uniref:chemotaxis protein n=1 Tax=Burkholderia sp. Ax-1719 TaxID=2608334 RepID=UPI00141D7E7A|nr:chemotaxis protein [Burkholderia sp. Ax-1719]NIE62893.1 chemotaxis protein [Burkholderia sp. Ax-1719]
MTSTLDPDNDDEMAQPLPPGHDTESLGPGDSSDSGSDTVGAKRHDFDRDSELDNHALEAGEDEAQSDSDSHGTGERASADGDETLRPDGDILPDTIKHEPDY